MSGQRSSNLSGNGRQRSPGPARDSSTKPTWQTLTPEAKQKLDVKALRAETDPKTVKDKVKRWQELVEPESLVTPDDSISQVGRLDLPHTPRSAPQASIARQTNSQLSTPIFEERRPRVVRVPSPTKLAVAPPTRAVNVATTPRRRIVSDEHWKSSRQPKGASKSAPRPPKTRVQESSPWTSSYTRADGVKYNAWVRPKASTTNKEGQAESDGIQQPDNIDSGSPKKRGVSDNEPGPRRAAREAWRHQASKEKPRLEPLSALVNDIGSVDAAQPGRIEAWLSGGLDPFTEDTKKLAKHVRTPKSYKSSASSSHEESSNISPPQKNPKGEEPASSIKVRRDDKPRDDDSQLSSPTPHLRRSGARRKSMSVKAENSPEDTRDAQRKPSGHHVSTHNELVPAPTPGVLAVEATSLSISAPTSRGSHPLSVACLSDLNRLQPSQKSFGPRTATHADLISVLSLPVDEQRALKPASTLRRRPSKPSSRVDAILKSFTNDEALYQKDLQTLVDGVIPVLLKSAIAKAKIRIMPVVGKDSEVNGTAAVVRLGIVLERLKGLHKRCDSTTAETLVSWAQTVQAVYADYIAAWHAGYESTVIDLAPSASSGETSSAKVEVTYLLKRPLVRIKYLAKTFKGLSQAQSIPHCASEAKSYSALLELAKERQGQERARLEDEAAANIDTTKVRCIQSMLPLPGIAIDRSLSVYARDYFELSMKHSSGQQMDCRAELILRRNDPKAADRGDLLICQVDTTSRWLLFPPVKFNAISSKIIAGRCSMRVMLRQSGEESADFQLLDLVASDLATVQDWIEMLGSNPVPPDELPSTLQSGPEVSEPPTPIETASQILVPIGEAPDGMSSLSDRRDKKRAHFLEDPVTPPPLSPAVSSEGNRRFFFSKFRGTDTAVTTGQSQSVDKKSLSAPQPDKRGRSRDRHGGESISTEGHNRTDRSAFREHSEARSVISSSSKSFSVWLPSSRSDDFNAEDEEEDTGSFADGSLPSPTKSSSTAPSDNLSDYNRVSRRFNDLRSQKRETGGYINPAPVSKQQSTAIVPSRDSPQGRSNPTQLPASPVINTAPRLQSSPATSDLPPGRRRTSSPLKHEYAPSEASVDSSVDGILPSDDEGSITSESSMDEDIIPPPPPLHIVKRIANQVLSNKSPSTVRPSESASQAPFREVPVTDDSPSNMAIASIFCWSEKGVWQSLHSNDCSIVVSPGLIEAFEMSAAHSKSTPEMPESVGKRPGGVKPLVALELTPLVPLRRGTAIDISVRSPPTQNSALKTGNNIMFRSRNNYECDLLYGLINQARINNPTYIALQNARPAGPGAWAPYMDRQGSRAPSSWLRFLGKKNSYRAGNSRRTGSVTHSENSVASMSSAISALKRLSAGSKVFDIAKSTVTGGASGPGGSRSTTTFSSSSGGAGSGSSTPVIADLIKGAGAGITNTKIRIYRREAAGRWLDMGSARLTIMHPPRTPGAPPILDRDGRLIQEKRVVVVGKIRGETMLDVTLGESSFERVARTGLAVSVWEDFGVVGKTGGVNTARANVFMLQMKSEAEAAHAFSLVGRLRY